MWCRAPAATSAQTRLLSVHAGTVRPTVALESSWVLTAYTVGPRLNAQVRCRALATTLAQRDRWVLTAYTVGPNDALERTSAVSSISYDISATRSLSPQTAYTVGPNDALERTSAASSISYDISTTPSLSPHGIHRWTERRAWTHHHREFYTGREDCKYSRAIRSNCFSTIICKLFKASKLGWIKIASW